MTDDEKHADVTRKVVEMAKSADWPAIYAVLYATRAEWKEKVGTDWPGSADWPEGERCRFIMSNGKIDYD